MTRILQLSDTHIVPEGTLCYGVVDTAAALETAVRTVNRMLPVIGPIDLAVVTGDLTDRGTAEEYRRFAAIMSALEVPYRVVPGNHDHRDSLRAAYADRDWMPEDGAIQWLEDLDDLAVLGLDSSVDGAPHGELPAERLDWLRDRLAAVAPMPILVMLHHPPVATGILPMDRQGLRDADGLRRILEAYPGPRRLACGHIHRMITADYGATPLVIAPGTSHAVTLDLRDSNPHSLTMEPGGVLLHELADGFRTHFIPVGAYDGPHPFAGMG